ncbi:hypothetical protein J3R30DRAFT_2738350 [Lentinula aciculospora]|uniref:Uncharacterized protein n=1 Tax=Lentinula aciculospora TaxID=153920 RepID=A0A9W9ABX4_9AGAR|nr:hypothetical protein J3R30DRAFT_2738350 [Lentinula aciculospora]
MASSEYTLLLASDSVLGNLDEVLSDNTNGAMQSDLHSNTTSFLVCAKDNKTTINTAIKVAKALPPLPTSDSTASCPQVANSEKEGGLNASQPSQLTVTESNANGDMKTLEDNPNAILSSVMLNMTIKTYADATNIAKRYPELAPTVLAMPLSSRTKSTSLPVSMSHTNEKPNWAVADSAPELPLPSFERTGKHSTNNIERNNVGRVYATVASNKYLPPSLSRKEAFASVTTTMATPSSSTHFLSDSTYITEINSTKSNFRDKPLPPKPIPFYTRPSVDSTPTPITIAVDTLGVDYIPPSTNSETSLIVGNAGNAENSSTASARTNLSAPNLQDDWIDFGHQLPQSLDPKDQFSGMNRCLNIMDCIDRTESTHARFLTSLDPHNRDEYDQVTEDFLSMEEDGWTGSLPASAYGGRGRGEFCNESRPGRIRMSRGSRGTGDGRGRWVSAPNRGPDPKTRGNLNDGCEGKRRRVDIESDPNYYASRDIFLDIRQRQYDDEWTGSLPASAYGAMSSRNLSSISKRRGTGGTGRGQGSHTNSSNGNFHRQRDLSRKRDISFNSSSPSSSASPTFGVSGLGSRQNDQSFKDFEISHGYNNYNGDKNSNAEDQPRLVPPKLGNRLNGVVPSGETGIWKTPNLWVSKEVDVGVEGSVDFGASSDCTTLPSPTVVHRDAQANNGSKTSELLVLGRPQTRSSSSIDEGPSSDTVDDFWKNIRDAWDVNVVPKSGSKTQVLEEQWMVPLHQEQRTIPLQQSALQRLQ